MVKNIILPLVSSSPTKGSVKLYCENFDYDIRKNQELYTLFHFLNDCSCQDNLRSSNIF